MALTSTGPPRGTRKGLRDRPSEGVGASFEAANFFLILCSSRTHFRPHSLLHGLMCIVRMGTSLLWTCKFFLNMIRAMDRVSCVPRTASLFPPSTQTVPLHDELEGRDSCGRPTETRRSRGPGFMTLAWSTSSGLLTLSSLLGDHVDAAVHVLLHLLLELLGDRVLRIVDLCIYLGAGRMASVSAHTSPDCCRE